jgi:hypothetical protein
MHWRTLSYLICYLFNTHFTSVVQQPYGYNITGQLQESKDLIRPATAKIVFTILKSPEASLLQLTSVASHLTLTPDFSSIRLSRPRGCINSTESLAERQRRSPHGYIAAQLGIEPATSRLQAQWLTNCAT